MPKHSSHRRQKMYKMKGCSSTRKNYKGGDTLAYPTTGVPRVPNPFLAYNGKGGRPVANINAANPTIPNAGPVPRGPVTWNQATPQHGGCVGCSLHLPTLMKGGTLEGGSLEGGCGDTCPIQQPATTGGCGSACALGFMVGGVRHRKGCKCSDCKSRRGSRRRRMKGGAANGALVGGPWTSNPSTWPGVSGQPGVTNYYADNKYINDISRQMIATGANKPFSVGGKKRGQKGGNLSNFLTQDFLNLGRQLSYGLGSTYNAIAGYPAPVNPLPWKDQMVDNGRKFS